MSYPSDLTDKEWQILQEIFPTRKVGGFKRKNYERELLNAIFHIIKLAVGDVIYLQMTHLGRVFTDILPN